MAWSTQQLADLAGTTVKAVRYYHQLELLEVPERASNGYKQYGVPHLIRLLQIRRLRDLGVPLSQMPATGHEDETPEEAIRSIDANLELKIAHLNRVRAELALILEHRAPAYLPAGFAEIGGQLNERQRSLLVVYGSVLSEESLEHFHSLLSESDDLDEEFESLAADADEATINRLAAGMVPVVRRSREEHPWLHAPAADSPRGSEQAVQTMGEAVLQLYNRAQLRVLARMNNLIQEETQAEADRASE